MSGMTLSGRRHSTQNTALSLAKFHMSQKNWIQPSDPSVAAMKFQIHPNRRREFIMLTRRGFAGFACCAICGITGFIATDASAQGAPPATTPGVTRKIISQTDGPVPGYVTIVAQAEIEPGATVARHTHPGIESGYILEGGFDLPIEGQTTRTYKPGDVFQVPPETPHAGKPNGDKKSVILITLVVEKGKPIASPA
jgi:quercetin dioxygenase-like cupin family protein